MLRAAGGLAERFGRFMSIARLLALCALCLACDRRLDPYVPPEQEPARSERPVRIPGLELPAPSAADPNAALAGAMRGTAAQAVGDSIRGTLRLAPGVAGPGEGVLFVIARAPSGGPPLAVKRLELGSFPMDFEIGAADAMLPGRPLEGEVQLSARIDRDGNPMTRSPEDLVAEIQGSVRVGAGAVELVLGLGAP